MGCKLLSTIVTSIMEVTHETAYAKLFKVMRSSKGRKLYRDGRVDYNHYSETFSPVYGQITYTHFIMLELRKNSDVSMHCAYKTLRLVLKRSICRITTLTQDSLGNTPLHYATMLDDKEFVAILLKDKEGSVALQMKNNNSLTPIDVAEKCILYCSMQDGTLKELTAAA